MFSNLSLTMANISFTDLSFIQPNIKRDFGEGFMWETAFLIASILWAPSITSFLPPPKANSSILAGQTVFLTASEKSPFSPVIK